MRQHCWKTTQQLRIHDRQHLKLILRTCELQKDALGVYILRQTFEPEIEQETQTQHLTTSQPQETLTEQLNQQSTSTNQSDE